VANQLGKRQAIAIQRVQESSERCCSQEPGEYRRVLEGKVFGLDGPLQWSIWSWSGRLPCDSQTAPGDPIVQVTHAQDGAEIVGTDRQRIEPLGSRAVLYRDSPGLRWLICGGLCTLDERIGEAGSQVDCPPALGTMRERGCDVLQVAVVA